MQDHRRIGDKFRIATIAFDRSFKVNHTVLEVELASFIHSRWPDYMGKVTESHEMLFADIANVLILQMIEVFI